MLCESLQPPPFSSHLGRIVTSPASDVSWCRRAWRLVHDEMLRLCSIAGSEIMQHLTGQYSMGTGRGQCRMCSGFSCHGTVHLHVW